MVIIGVVLLLAALGALMVALDLFTPQTDGFAATARRIRVRASGTGSSGLTVNDELGRLRVLTTSSQVAKARRNFVLAGRPPAWTLRRLMVYKITAAAATGALLTLHYLGEPSGKRLGMLLGMSALAFVLPDLRLGSMATDRQARIERELPDVLDQVVIAIESGLSFEGAIDRVAGGGDGELAGELRRSLQDMQLGMSRRAAYQSLADRTSIEDLRRFTKQVTQAEEFGVSVATVVRNLASEMRLKRRYRAEEVAQKIPVKIIMPLAACFLPVLFAVILYPFFSSLLSALGG